MRKKISTIFQNGFMSVNSVVNRELTESDNEFVVFGRNKTKHGAIIIPVTNDGKIILTKEYRIGADEYVIGIPKGAADQPDEKNKSIASRELKEELGVRFHELQETPVKIYPLPAFADFYGQVVIAKGCEFVSKASLEDGEDISVHKLVSRTELRSMILNGEINDAESLAALQHYLL